MTMTEFIQAAVEAGIAEVKEAGHKPHEERGALAGFEKCRKLGSIEQFEAELDRCRQEEIRLRDKRRERRDVYSSIKGRSDANSYWEQRYFTLQVEHVYKLLCFAARHNRWPGHERLLDLYCNSARAAMQYAKIVGVMPSDTAED